MSQVVSPPEFAKQIGNDAMNQQRLHTDMGVAGSEAFNMTLASESIGVMDNSRQFV